MREYELVIDEAFRNGLSPEENSPTNSQLLEECIGFRCGKAGLEGYREKSSSVISTFDMLYSWPYPQVLTGEKYNFLIVRDATVNMEDVLYQLSDDGQTLTHILAIDQLTFGQGTLMEAADFGKYAFLTNGVVMIYWTSIGWEKVTANDNIPMMRTVCNFRGQMVGGGVLSDWHDCDETFYVWSKIGEADFTPDKKNTAGYKKDPFGGVIYHVRVLGRSVIGYSSKGVVALTPVSDPVSTFGFEELSDVGLINQGAINGNGAIQVYIGDDYIIRRVTKNGVEEIGYQHLIEQLAGEDIIVTFDPSLKDFYIGNSSKTFLLSPNGMTESPQHPSAMWRREKETYCEPYVVDDYYPTIKTWPFNFGYAGQKTVFTVETDAKGTDGGRVIIDTTNDQNVWTASSISSLNNQGISTKIRSGNEFKFSLLFDDAPYGSIISYLKVRYKMTDLRGIRGVYAPPLRGQG